MRVSDLTPERKRLAYLALVVVQLAVAVLVPGDPRLTGSVFVAQLIVAALVYWTRTLGITLAALATAGSVVVLAIDAAVSRDLKSIVMTIVEIVTLVVVVGLSPRWRRYVAWWRRHTT
jgi:hypothetical protein